MQTEVTESKKAHQSNDTAVELKGSVFTLPILQIQTTSISDIASELSERLSKALKFFDNAPVVIDLKAISDSTENLDFNSLMQVLSQRHLIPVGVRNGSSQQNSLAISAGLAILKGAFSDRVIEDKKAEVQQTTETNKNPQTSANTEAQTPVRKSKIITTPVRSGQQIYARESDLIIMAPVNHGAEIIADGNIHIYSSMRGRALAGVRGDVDANIFCQSMEAELVAVAGNFRVFEEDMPAEIKSKSVRIHLEGEHLIISEL